MNYYSLLLVLASTTTIIPSDVPDSYGAGKPTVLNSTDTAKATWGCVCTKQMDILSCVCGNLLNAQGKDTK